MGDDVAVRTSQGWNVAVYWTLFRCIDIVDGRVSLRNLRIRSPPSVIVILSPSRCDVLLSYGRYSSCAIVVVAVSTILVRIVCPADRASKINHPICFSPISGFTASHCWEHFQRAEPLGELYCVLTVRSWCFAASSSLLLYDWPSRFRLKYLWRALSVVFEAVLYFVM